MTGKGAGFYQVQPLLALKNCKPERKNCKKTATANIIFCNLLKHNDI